MPHLGRAKSSQTADPHTLAGQLFEADPAVARIVLDDVLGTVGIDRMITTEDAIEALGRTDERIDLATTIPPGRDRAQVITWRCDFAAALCELIIRDRQRRNEG